MIRQDHKKQEIARRKYLWACYLNKTASANQPSTTTPTPTTKTPEIDSPDYIDFHSFLTHTKPKQTVDTDIITTDKHRQKLNQMFSMIKNTKYRYMMVSLFGVTCNQWRIKHPGVSQETKCIGTLIGVNSYMGLYISHIAVSSENYSKGVFTLVVNCEAIYKSQILKDHKIWNCP